MAQTRAPSDCRGFPFLGDSACHTLILGSMPGEASLRAGEYYGHPRNAFWGILARVSGVPADAPYPVRTRGLLRAGIALWDVLGRCRRTGSLDSAIEPHDRVVNDFTRLFDHCPGIQRVFCNGTLAHTLYQRQVRPRLSSPWRDLAVVRLPSTSPAHAGRSAREKHEAWWTWLLPPPHGVVTTRKR